MDTNENINSREWRTVEGYEGLYELRNDGLLYSHPRNTTKGGYSYGNDDMHKGYLKKVLCGNGVKKQVRMNRLVYETFIGPIPEGYDVHHINHNKKDNRVENLELIEKSTHAKKHIEETPNKLIKATQKVIEQYTLDGEFIAEYASINEASRITNISTSNICKCCKGLRNKAGGFIWRYKDTA